MSILHNAVRERGKYLLNQQENKEAICSGAVQRKAMPSRFFAAGRAFAGIKQIAKTAGEKFFLFSPPPGKRI